MPNESERVRMQHKHIFIVNGSPLFLDMMRMFLQDESYNVTTTNFVPRTFEQIAGLQPDLLIIDLAMGQEAGWELLARLKTDAMMNQVPTIVVSTQPSLLEKAQAEPEQYGGNLFISKPFNLDDILGGIRSLIGEALTSPSSDDEPTQAEPGSGPSSA